MIDGITKKPLGDKCHELSESQKTPVATVATPKTAEPCTPKQVAGCLPEGYSQDSLLTVEQFAAWMQIKESTVRSRLPWMPGVVRQSRELIRIHPRTFLEKTIKK